MSTNIEHSSCTESQLPLSEIMLRTLHDFQGFKKTLEEDTSERAVQNMMVTLSEYKLDKHLPGSISIFFMATVDGLQTPTHKQLLSEISGLIDKLEKEIPVQKEKEIQIQKQKEMEVLQAAQQDTEGTQPQQNEECAQPQQPNMEDIRAKQHKANVNFVEAILTVLLIHSDEITSWLEDYMK